MHACKCESMCSFASLSVFGFVGGYCGALTGMCRSACKCLLLKQTRHFSPTGPEPHHHNPWNLKPDAGSWAARVIRGTHHAGGVTVWLRCPIRHSTDWLQPTLPRTDARFATLSPGWSRVARGPLYRRLYGSHGYNLSIHLQRLV